MEPKCPFLDVPCLRDKCQLWVSTGEKTADCAFAAIPGMIGRELSRVESRLTDLTRMVSGLTLPR